MCISDIRHIVQCRKSRNQRKALVTTGDKNTIVCCSDLCFFCHKDESHGYWSVPRFVFQIFHVALQNELALSPWKLHTDVNVLLSGGGQEDAASFYIMNECWNISKCIVFLSKQYSSLQWDWLPLHVKTLVTVFSIRDLFTLSSTNHIKVFDFDLIQQGDLWGDFHSLSAWYIT